MQVSLPLIYSCEGNLAHFLHTLHPFCWSFWPDAICLHVGCILMNFCQLILRNFHFQHPCQLTIAAYTQHMSVTRRQLPIEMHGWTVLPPNPWNAIHFMPTSEKVGKIAWAAKNCPRVVEGSPKIVLFLWKKPLKILAQMDHFYTHSGCKSRTICTYHIYVMVVLKGLSWRLQFTLMIIIIIINTHGHFAIAFLPLTTHLLTELFEAVFIEKSSG